MECLREMLSVDSIGAAEVGDGECDGTHSLISARAQLAGSQCKFELLYRVGRERRRIEVDTQPGVAGRSGARLDGLRAVAALLVACEGTRVAEAELTEEMDDDMGSYSYAGCSVEPVTARWWRAVRCPTNRRS